MSGDLTDEGIDPAEMDRIRGILAGVEAADLELVEPPADLWGQIEASLTSERSLATTGPKQSPSSTPSTSMVVEYWIDANDVVTHVGEDWADFARHNDAPELAAQSPDRTLWTYFDKEEIRELWQLLVARVRATNKQAQVPLRCDGPHARRWFTMTIAPEADGRVHFRSVLAFEEPRSRIALLDPHCERDDTTPPVALCSWCGRGEHESQWLDIEELVQEARLLERTSMPPIAYGICSPCRDDMSAELLVPAVDDSTA